MTLNLNQLAYVGFFVLACFFAPVLAAFLLLTLAVGWLCSGDKKRVRSKSVLVKATPMWKLFLYALGAFSILVGTTWFFA